MGQQPTLFDGEERKQTPLEPYGFRYQEEFLNEENERALLAALRGLNLRPFEFHGHIGNRRVVSFGLKYNFSRRSVELAAEIPTFLNGLLVRAAHFAGFEREAFRQVGVNEYRTGAGIGWHKDKPEFGVVVGVSLGASAVMRFRKPHGATWERISHKLLPRSIYVLDGESRSEWEHSIPVVSDLRYSITFRTLAG